MPKERRHHCNNCNTSFSVTVGTIFHRTRLDLQKWFLAVALVLNAKKGISARQLARDLDVNKDTAWSMAMRIRNAMVERNDRKLLEGVVEMDETYIGGKPRRGAGVETKRGRGTNKVPVVGVVERGGKVRAKLVKDVKAKTLASFVREHVDVKSATVITDEFKGYIRFAAFVNHETVNHQKWYVEGNLHTNSVESFWSLLKRGIIGQYHKVSIKYLPRYIDEFCYRYNNRQTADLFDQTISHALGVINV
ncbi:MAG: IS1595 family transposase [Proteobacteria bacterium]|nr:IS1595 family transposase [Pseudomonadota bacterium]